MTVRRLADGSWESPATRQATPEMNIPKMLRLRAENYPSQVAIERRSPVGAWRPVTIDQFLADADSLARGLIAHPTSGHSLTLPPCRVEQSPYRSTKQTRPSRLPIFSKMPTFALSSLRHLNKLSLSSLFALSAFGRSYRSTRVLKGSWLRPGLKYRLKKFESALTQ